MSTIGGKRKENTENSDYSKKVGLFEARVIAINPTAEQYKNLLNIELKEDSKATEYLGTNNDGNDYLRVDVWLEDVKDENRFKTTFFLEDKVRENKDRTKKQYINNVGVCSWADDENNLPDWFKSREYREAYVGEEDFYSFLRTWLGNLDYRDADTVLQLEWKKLMRGNLRDLTEQIGGEWSTNVVALATIISREKDGEVKEYQGIYNKAFLPAYSLKNFRLVDYDNKEILEQLKSKKPKDLKPHERFVLQLTGEYGCKDFFLLKDLQDYNPDMNLVASNEPLSSDGDDY